MSHAVAAHGRFGIVTGGAAWGEMLAEFVGSLGLGDHLAAIRTIAPSGGEIAEDPDRALDALAQACRDCADDGADAVILGGAGLAGLARRIQPRVERPLICSVEAGVEATLAAIGASLPPRTGMRMESVGLAPALAGLLP